MGDAKIIILNIFEWLQDNVAKLLVDVVIAILTLLVGFIIGRFSGRLLHKLLDMIGIEKRLGKKSSGKYQKAISDILTYTIYLLTILIVLGQLGLTSTVIYIVLGLLFVVLLISVSLGFLDLLPNFFNSISLKAKKPYKVGDAVKIGIVEGKVHKITWLETQITNAHGDLIHVPNSKIDAAKVVILGNKAGHVPKSRTKRISI